MANEKVNGAEHELKREPTPYERELARANELHATLIRWITLAQAQRQALIIAASALDNIVTNKEVQVPVIHPHDLAYLHQIIAVTRAPQMDVETFMNRTERLTRAVTHLLHMMAEFGDDAAKIAEAVDAVQRASFTLEEAAGLVPAAALAAAKQEGGAR